MSLPKFSSVFTSSRYLRQVQPSGFDKYYCGPRAYVFELLAMAIGFILPEQVESLPPEWRDWAIGLGLLYQWCQTVAGNVREYTSWEGLRSEMGLMMGNLMTESGQSLDLDNTRLFEAIAQRFWVSIVWFEEKSREEIRTRFYRVPQATFPCPFVYMGIDMEESIYAFHHPLQNGIHSEIYWGIPALQPPIVIGTPPFPDNPNQILLKLGLAIVSAIDSVPVGAFSPPILQDAQCFLSSWKQLSRTGLEPPLDNDSLNVSLQRVFSPSFSTVLRRPEHNINECKKHLDFGEFISHGESGRTHSFHVICLRIFIEAKRKKIPLNQPILCPLCIKAFSDEIFEKLDQYATQEVGARVSNPAG